MDELADGDRVGEALVGQELPTALLESGIRRDIAREWLEVEL